MRIRRRPPPSLSPQNPNFSLQIQPPNTREEKGLHQDGDLSVAPSDPHPQQVFKEEKDSFPSSSSSCKKTLDAQVHNNKRIEEEINAKSNIATSINNEVAIEEVNNGKKRRSPQMLAEGSRCSRVNGRGWRCSQQTLIGYSLCEHHLGKGRIRSIKSVTRKPMKKEREKIGMVKARTISSLLDEDVCVDAIATDGSNMAMV